MSAGPDIVGDKVETNVLCNKVAASCLVEGLKKNDPRSYRIFLDSYYTKMYWVAHKFLGSHEETNDCLQDAFISVIENINKFEGRSELATWVHRIVVNSALASLKSRSKHLAIELVEELPQYDHNGFLIWPLNQVFKSVEQVLEDEEAINNVNVAIESLAIHHRETLVLRDIQGYSTEETASILGITSGAVKVRLHRARSALRDLLVPTLTERTVP